MTSVTPEPPAAGALAVAPSRRGLRVTAYVVVVAVLLGVVGWVSTHPDSLPTSSSRVRASTPVGEPVFIGVFAATAGFDRSLHISGVRVFATSTNEVTITPHVCSGGSINVTTTPDAFCSTFGPTEGATFDPGDAIVLEVVGDAPGVVAVDRVRIAYRDGLQWGTQDAGSPAQVTVLPR